jgi:hypothetical protein
MVVYVLIYYYLISNYRPKKVQPKATENNRKTPNIKLTTPRKRRSSQSDTVTQLSQSSQASEESLSMAYYDINNETG